MLNSEDLKKKLIHFFGEETTSPLLNKELVGEKGQKLAIESSLGLPIPPGLILTTQLFLDYIQAGKKLTKKAINFIFENIALLEKELECSLGSPKNPLIISLRPTTVDPIPGERNLILNLGFNDQSVESFAKVTKNERLAYDSYRQSIMCFGEIIGGVSKLKFQNIFNAIKMQEGADLDIDLSIDGLKEICDRYKSVYLKECSLPFPQNCHDQIIAAIEYLFNSWESNCKMHALSNTSGIAIIIQKKVFGNKNDQSASGTIFTRNPSSGENWIYGEFLPNAQNDEVAFGIRTPRPINIQQKKHSHSNVESLEELSTPLYLQLKDFAKKLESHYKEMIEIEFTIEDNKLYITQTRNGKRTGIAALRIAHEMYEEGLIDENAVTQRISSTHFQQLFAPIFNEKIKHLHKDKLVTHGINIAPGAASGSIAFSPLKVTEMKAQGIPSILVREESGIEDFQGIIAAEGVLTLGGGCISCTAIFAREIGKPCIVGCKSLHINETAKTLSIAGLTLKEGDAISIDGSTGEVFFCRLETSPSEIFKALITKDAGTKNSPSYQKFKFVRNLLEKYSNVYSL